MSFDPHSPSDRADQEPDVATIDWNGKLWASTPPPQSGMVWIVTDEGDVHEVSYSDENRAWTGRDAWFRQDGESGSWEADEILGWTESREDAEEAAELLLKAVA